MLRRDGKTEILGVSLAALFLFSGLTLLNGCMRAKATSLGNIEWTALAVSTNTSQADANLIRFPTGEIYLIDAGDVNKNLGPLLRLKGVDHVDKVFISHPHPDHYRGLRSMMDGSISIGTVYMNMPDKGRCDAEIPWGCNYQDVTQLISELQAKGIGVQSMNAGDIVHSNGATQLQVLYAFDGVNTPIGQTDINDTSVIMKLTDGITRVLFTGDLNQGMGEYLSSNDDGSLSADLIKVPHHGTEGTVPDSFFKTVGAAMGVVPAPAPLWTNARSARIKNWFMNNNIPAYVTGLQGNVTVTLQPIGFQISTLNAVGAPPDQGDPTQIPQGPLP
jgi:beta-lactamase superfamily II metal-dependent hydrolase